MSRRRKHHDREELAGEYRFGDIGQIILLIIFLAVWMLDSFVFRYSTFLGLYVPIFIRIPCAAILLVLSGYLAKKGLDTVFGERQGTPGVVSRDVFGLVRHPIYLGSILFYLGLLFLTFSLFAAIVWLVIIGFYCYLAVYEEKLLLRKFGTAYEEYMKHVPMWIPFTRMPQRKE